MLRQPQVLPNHNTFIATGPGCDFFLWFVSFLREKRNEHPQAYHTTTTVPKEKDFCDRYYGSVQLRYQHAIAINDKKSYNEVR